MFDYLKAENLKNKRTFAKKLIFLSPLITIVIALLSPLWFETNGYNQWYVIMLPGLITLLVILTDQKEDKKLSYRAIYSLPIDLRKVWFGKSILISLYVLLSNLLMIIGSKSTGYIFNLPMNISISKGIIAAIIMVITTFWQIPFTLFLCKKLSLLGGILVNFGFGMLLNIMLADSNNWWLSPYSYTSRLMASFLKINPNGIPLETGDSLTNSSVIPIGISISIALAIVVTLVTAHWFEAQEAK